MPYITRSDCLTYSIYILDAFSKNLINSETFVSKTLVSELMLPEPNENIFRHIVVYIRTGNFRPSIYIHRWTSTSRPARRDPSTIGSRFAALWTSDAPFSICPVYLPESSLILARVARWTISVAGWSTSLRNERAWLAGRKGRDREETSR